MSRTKKVLLWSAGLFVGVVIAARLAAPHYLLEYVNRTLDGLDGYSGHVGDLDLHIWRGAYEIEDVAITKDGVRGQQIPFVSVDEIDISVHWDALLEGAIVAELELLGPKVNYIAEKKKESKEENAREQREAKKAKTGDSSWQKQVKELVPLNINRIEISDGEIHFRDGAAKPPVNLAIKNFRGRLTNLTNSEDLSESMVATAKFQGVAMNSGQFEIDARIDPYKETPTFDLNARLEHLQVKELNDFLKAYANFDAERGRISVFTEVACANGRFKGYVKPLIRDLRVLRWKEEEEGALGKLWEGLVEAGTELFENDEKEQVATRIPFSGRLESPQADIGTTVVYILRNAFVRALSGGIDESIADGKLSAAGEQKKKGED
jgi:hypothetical protein